MASVTTAGSLRDDAAPIEPPTPMARAWSETARSYQAKPAVWRIADDDLVYRTLRKRSDEMRRASGQDPTAVDRSVADMESWCARHRKIHAQDRPCWGYSRQAGLNNPFPAPATSLPKPNSQAC